MHRVFAELMLDKITSLDRENLHEVFLTLIKIQRNNKKQNRESTKGYYFCNFRKKMLVFIVLLLPHAELKAHSPVMCEIEISNRRKINLIIAYCFILGLREEHLENAFA